MIRFNSFKNTFLFLFLTCIACGNTTTQKSGANSDSRNEGETSVTESTVVDPIVTGAERIAAYLPLLKDKKVGVIANPTSIIQGSKETDPPTHLVDSLLASGIDIVRVFSPEHGFRGNVDAGEEISDGSDSKTGLPIISLYGKNKKPLPDQLKGLDILVFDIQDVGVRFYTYISTLHYVMEACAEEGKKLIVLDRPNPNCSYIDGPVLEKKHSSFLGMHEVPLVYGMTIGEYAQMINGEKWLKNGVHCDLEVITLKNYNREMSYSLPIRPSPNLPNDQSIALYPGLGLFEGTTINAGRGTSYQFQRYGAPELDPEVFEFSYVPEPNFGSKSPKHQGEKCYGEDLSSITPPQKVNLGWIMKAYNHSNDKEKFFLTASFTKHAGTESLQEQIVSGVSETAIRLTWKPAIDNFKKIRAAYLLYP
ncbi:exo-beta-N-acetylmuramidase NamZ family protein [Robertkochia solimangrovi]|uniref:exo-beta-N-acetylmuramidase NamZ family protein n=1 Tax=Robertkochia solimangrovi TaxID=2213046 RepID=UPI00117EB510|nr:DUF1343 domain-containing protein [Robertkochia solimangrovi]TRZ42022.1 DUF1343 domain-containing protein [Robertkochia solimangrovi]